MKKVYLYFLFIFFMCLGFSAEANTSRKKAIKILTREIRIMDSVIAKFKRDQAKTILQLNEKRAVMNKQDSLKKYEDSIFKNRIMIDSAKLMEVDSAKIIRSYKNDTIKNEKYNAIQPDNPLRTEILQLENKKIREEFTLIKLDFERLKLLNELDKLVNRRKRKKN